MFRYTVRCEFSSADPSLVSSWIDWLRDEHLADVIEAGAAAAEIVHMDADQPTYEVRYRFESRAHFEVYERDHAPRLRADGIARFPLSLGLNYSRTTGEVVK